jgi:hypothetical protein
MARGFMIESLLRSDKTTYLSAPKEGAVKETELCKWEHQIFCVNPFSAFKFVHPNGPQNKSSTASIS